MQVFHIITGLNNGGAEGVLYRLCTHDKIAQHTVISLMDMGKYGPLLQRAGITVQCLNMPQGKFTFSGIIKLYRILKANKPDIVQTWMYHADLIGGMVAKFAGIKNIFWGIRHSTLEKGKSRRSTIIIAKFCAFLSKLMPKGIICCADEALKVHADIGYDHSKLSVIYNGYPLDQLTINPVAKIAIREELGITKVNHVLGMVGRYNTQKDHANLLAALADVKQDNIDFVCLLVGANMNADNQELMGLIKANKLEDHIKLLCQRCDIPNLMNALDAHILSSSGEGFPNVIAEAMACGTPCVATDVGDAAMIIGNTGWVVPSKNSAELAKAIQQSMHEKKILQEQWENRIQSARQRVEYNFNIETMVSKYHEIWSS